jgi:hypothetical protein
MVGGSCFLDLIEWWGWSVSTEVSDPGLEILVASRKILVSGPLTLSLRMTIIEIVLGTYSFLPEISSVGWCLFLELKNAPKPILRWNYQKLKGPEYWSNSCNTDSVITIIAYSMGVSFRKNILSDALGIPEKEEVAKSLLFPSGRCKLVRDRLLTAAEVDPAEWREMRSSGQVYDMLSDYFPSLKIPIVQKFSNGSRTVFYSAIPLEEYISGSINLTDFNHPLLVLESHLGYENPFDMTPEEGRPKKVNVLGEVLGDYLLVGVIYHTKAQAGGVTIKGVYASKMLGSHYHAVLRLAGEVLPFGRWYSYDDLRPSLRPMTDPPNFSLSNGPGVMFFYQRTTKPSPQEIIVIDDTKILISVKKINQVAELAHLVQTLDFEPTSIKATFVNIEARIEFEIELRKG